MKLIEQTLSKRNDGVEVNLTVFLIKDDDSKSWVAFCPALNLSSYGETQPEAKAAFDDALEIFIHETHKMGTLEKYLLKHGWTLKQLPKPVYNPPRLLQRTITGLNASKQFDRKIALPA